MTSRTAGRWEPVRLMVGGGAQVTPIDTTLPLCMLRGGDRKDGDRPRCVTAPGHKRPHVPRALGADDRRIRFVERATAGAPSGERGGGWLCDADHRVARDQRGELLLA
jgi:hypothetical protein